MCVCVLKYGPCSLNNISSVIFKLFLFCFLFVVVFGFSCFDFAFPHFCFCNGLAIVLLLRTNFQGSFHFVLSVDVLFTRPDDLILL